MSSGGSMINPEFRRHVWLEITAHRLVAGPVLCIAVIVLISMIGKDFWSVVNSASLFIFVCMTVVWGGRNSYASMISEVRGLTWDAQRMSSLGPWELTWGKVFGSNAYMWYCAFFVLVAYIATIGYGTVENPVRTLLLGLLFALLCQFLGLLFGLMAISKKSVQKSIGGTSGSLIFIIFFFSFLSFLPYGNRNSPLYAELADWYFLRGISLYDVFIFSFAVFLLWAVYGAYHFMRQELQYKTTYLPWLLFSIFLVLYAAGFSANYEAARDALGAADMWMIFAFSVSLVLMFVSMFVDRKDPVRYRALIRGFMSRDLKDLPGLLPCWASSLGLLFVMALIVEFFGKGANMHRGFITMFFFAARDIALVLLLNFGKNPKRADMAALIYLLALYCIIPGIIFMAMGSDNKEALFFLWPWVSDHGIIAAVIEAVFTAALLIVRWNKNYSSINAPASQD